MGYKDFFELDAWKRARRFKLLVYGVVKRLPDHEKYGLASQMRRSARSIPANISEGHGRRTGKDEHHFCVIARGSLSETFNHLIDACDCDYITKQELCTLKTEWDEAGKVLNGYMSHLRIKMQGQNSNSLVQEDAVEYAKENTIPEELPVDDSAFLQLLQYQP